MISAILLLVLVGGLAVAYLIYSVREESVESTTRNVVMLYRLLWVLGFAFIMYSLLQYGGLAGYSLMFLTTVVFGILFLVYRPDQDVKQIRRQS